METAIKVISIACVAYLVWSCWHFYRQAKRYRALYEMEERHHKKVWGLYFIARRMMRDRVDWPTAELDAERKKNHGTD